MPRRPRQLAESEIYHAMVRGVNRDAIFLEDEDFERFLHALALTKEASGCSILAYCLMTNHVHLVIRTGPEPIGTVMKRLGVRYASWFNRKYGRVGHVFQDRFRSLPVEDDEYFVALLRYVWRNPVEAGLAGRPEDYRWSSRRLLGRFSHLIDGDELQQLLPVGALVESVETAPSLVLEVERPPGRARRHSREDVDRLIRRICGVNGQEEFHDLPAATRRRTINELRTRCVPYAQIALATGMSTSSVRRLHIAGDLLPGATE